MEDVLLYLMQTTDRVANNNFGGKKGKSAFLSVPVSSFTPAGLQVPKASLAVMLLVLVRIILKVTHLESNVTTLTTEDLKGCA